MTLNEAINQAALDLSNFSEAKAEALILLCAVLKRPKSYIYAYPEKEVTQEQANLFFSYIRRRQQGEPIAYILGKKEFWGLPLEVNSATLIPRPETELLVEYVLNLAGDKPQLRLADLGTGSGAIALALAHARPAWSIAAVDSSKEALCVAKSNAERLNITSVQFYLGNWCEPIQGKQFDFIVSNPPYIAEQDPHLLHLHYEPKTALVSGPEGLDAISFIIEQSWHILIPHGGLIFEHGYQQGEAVRSLLAAKGYRTIQTVKDYAGLERITWGFRQIDGK